MIANEHHTVWSVNALDDLLIHKRPLCGAYYCGLMCLKMCSLEKCEEHEQDRALTAEKFGVPYRTFYKWTRVESVLRDLARDRQRASNGVQQRYW